VPSVSSLRSAIAVAVWLIAILAACGGTLPPSGAVLPGPVSTATRDGLIVSVALEHAPLTAGVRAWAKVTVVNTAPVVRHYQGGGCEFLADVTIRTAAPVTPERGRDWDGLAGLFKKLVLPDGAPSADGSFVDERFVDQGGVVACPASLGLNEIRPGEQRGMKAAWAGEGQGVAAAACPARVIASFPYLGRQMAARCSAVSRSRSRP